MPTFLADNSAAVSLAIAGLIGLAVGIEREWSGHASGPRARFAGVRTFLMLGLLGGLAGRFLVEGWMPVAAVVLAGGAGLIVVAYLLAGRQPGADPDGTTEVAALVVLALGALAGMGELAVAGGICAIVVLALREKAALHGVVHRLAEPELRAGVQFAVLALVVLPLLPEGPYGPLGGIHPRALWAVVLLFSGLSFAGYLARRIAGPGLGYPITGLLGGLVSSTAVTLHFSRQSRVEPAMATPLALGVVGACTILLPRVTIIAAVLNPAMAFALWPYLVPPAVIGVIIVAGGLLRHRAGDSRSQEFKNQSPLRLWPAIQMALALQVVLMSITFVRETWGTPGILASAAVLGLTDVDALTLSMARMGETPGALSLAAQAVAVGILANTALKMALVLVLGAGGYRWRAAAGLLALGATVGASLWYQG